MTTCDLDTFVRQYVETLLWTGHDWDRMFGDNPTPLDENYGADDVSDAAMREIREDAESFVDANASDLSGIDPGQAGHDFALTRNHHGAGFWDRGLGEVGDRLTVASHAYGEQDLYVGDDGRLYV